MAMTNVPMAYDRPLEKITDPDRFFRLEKGAFIFTGESLEVRIPQRYRNYWMLSIERNVETLGVFDMVIDGKYQCALNILSKVTLCPEETHEKTIMDDDYLVCTWSGPGIFMASSTLVQDFNAIYCLYVEYLTLGHRLYNAGMDSMLFLFDRAEEFTGKGIGTDTATYGLLISHVCRDPKNLFNFYRYTTMLVPPALINLRSVNFSPTSTQARIVGSYRDDGLASALNYRQNKRQEYEDLLRGEVIEEQTA